MIKKFHIKYNTPINSKTLGGLIVISNVFYAFPLLAIANECGKVIKPLAYYNNISLYSLIIGFGLIFMGILSEIKIVKTTSFFGALLPFALWGYVHFLIDFTDLKKKVFAYNALAEGTLANIAEAQDRYKSEQDVFLKDLQELYSHTAGSHGINPCVRILKINADFNRWTAEAKHLSSPDTIRWDSYSGSSLKKG